MGPGLLSLSCARRAPARVVSNLGGSPAQFWPRRGTTDPVAVPTTGGSIAEHGANLDRSLIRRPLGFLNPYGLLEALVILVLLLAYGLQIAVAYLFRPLVDDVLVGGNLRLFIPIVVVVAFARAVSFALHALRG